MTPSEIVEKAITKAIAAGWITISDKWQIRGNGVYFTGDAVDIRLSFADIIFNHDFAKALWGEKILEELEEPWEIRGQQHLWRGGPEYFEFSGTLWQYHLQQLVIAADPIKYLGENI